MSYGKRKVEKSQEPEHTIRCYASGCTLRGSLSTEGGDEGRYFCRFHFGAEPDRWLVISERLREYEHIVLGAEEAHKITDVDWWRGRHEMMTQFFDQDPGLQPTEPEKNRRPWYIKRLNDWMNYLAGNGGKRPVPRPEPAVPERRFGNMQGLG